MAAANLCSDCQKTESILSTWEINFFTRRPLTCYHVKVQREDKKKIQFFAQGDAGMVSASERGLGPGQPDTHRNCWGKVGRTGHTFVSYLAVWMCLSCLTVEGDNLLIFLYVSVSFPFGHSLFFSLSLFGPLFLSLTSSVSFLQLFLSVRSPWLLWPTCGFIGQLSDDFRSILFNVLPVGVRKMSYLLQLSLQKYSKLLPAVRSSDGLQECNFCSSEFWMSWIVRGRYPVNW